jgi:hypothetical protein
MALGLILKGLSNDSGHRSAALGRYDTKLDDEFPRQRNGCAFHDIRHVIMITAVMHGVKP